MGVRGLTTYVRYNEHIFLKKYLLHDSDLVIDGYSLCYQLFGSCTTFPAFGGDYDKYGLYVKKFMSSLLKCKLNCYVIFDGAYEVRKLKTAYSRIKNRIRAGSRVDPASRNIGLSPFLIKCVFVQVLTEMKIPYTFCEFEGDDEIASMSRYLQCPVISFDSDFYIYNVSYIPFNTIDSTPMPFEENGIKKYGIQCKIFKVENLMKSFDLKDEVMPLIGTVLGNDYVKKKMFSKFFSQLKLPKGNNKKNIQQRSIHGLFLWLQNRSLESAISNIVGRMKKKKKRMVLMLLKRGMLLYSNNRSRSLQYFNIGANQEPTADSICQIFDQALNCIKNDNDDIEKDENNDGEKIEIIGTDNSVNIETENDEKEQQNDESENHDVIKEENNDNEKSDSSSDEESDASTNEERDDDSNESEISISEPSPEDESTEFDVVSPGRPNLVIPGWLADKMRKNQIPPTYFDLYTLQRHFIVCQPENYMDEDSYLCVLKILRYAFDLITDYLYDDLHYVTREKYYQYKFMIVGRDYAVPRLLDKNFKDLDQNDLHKCWEHFLKQTMPIDDNTLSVLPPNLRVAMIAILWWVKNCQISKGYVYSIFLSYIMIEIIDQKTGSFRGQHFFKNKYAEKLRLLKERKPPETKNVGFNKNKVQYEDCLVAASVLLEHFEFSNDIRKHPKSYDSEIMHKFAQFQCSLKQMNSLNSLCGNYYESTIYHRFFNGTFVYNIASKLGHQLQPENFVHQYLKGAFTVIDYFDNMCQIFEELTSKMQITVAATIPKRKKKKFKKQSKNTYDDFEFEVEI